MYSTDNGPHMNTWPDAGMTPFRNEKNSNWEGAYRVPAMVRWPGHDPGRHGAQRHRQPHRLVRHPARRRRRHRHRRPAQGRRRPGRHHATGCTSTATTSSTTSPASPTRARAALLLRLRRRRPDRVRYDNWKIVFLEQRAPGTLQVWAEPYTGCGCRRSSTCAPIRTSGPTSPRTPTTTGCSTTPGCWSRPRRTSLGCCRPSPSSRRGRSRRASASAKVLEKLHGRRGQQLDDGDRGAR